MKISVAIATYQGKKYLSSQLDSILECIQPGDEIVVSDDGSNDGTRELLNKYTRKGFPVVVVDNTLHSGNRITNNFLNAIMKCRNEIIVLCDQDDIWMRDRLNHIRKLHEEFDCIVTDGRVIDKNGTNMGQIFDSTKPSTSVLRNFAKLSILGCQLSFRRTFLSNCPLPPRDVHITHDWWLYMNALLRGKAHILHEIAFIYRRHDNNASNGLGKSKNPIRMRLYIRFKMLYYLVFWGIFSQERVLSSQ